MMEPDYKKRPTADFLLNLPVIKRIQWMQQWNPVWHYFTAKVRFKETHHFLQKGIILYYIILCYIILYYIIGFKNIKIRGSFPTSYFV